MNRRRHAGRRASLTALAFSVMCLSAVACGDGTPGFCEPLAEMEDLRELNAALDEGDLATARTEAQRLRDLAEEAPAEIRADFAALADGVLDIVELLEREEQASGAEGEELTTAPAEVERLREQLNSRLGELDLRSIRVSTWAGRECGLDLV